MIAAWISDCAVVNAGNYAEMSQRLFIRKYELLQGDRTSAIAARGTTGQPHDYGQVMDIPEDIFQKK